MTLTKLVERVRDHYVDQFNAFVDARDSACSRGHAEVKFRLPPPSELYQALACVDYVCNDGAIDAVYFQPDRQLAFDPIEGAFGATELTIESLSWDRVELRHDASAIPEQWIADWFQEWFDPDDARHDPAAKLGGIIHSLIIAPGAMFIDFGTASTQAFFDLLGLIERSGAKSVVVKRQE